MDHIVDYNFHTHTTRCGHAFGSDEEYILSAIASNIKFLGFSDHAPLPHIHRKKMRMDFNELDNYISSITNLKNKYKDKITIFIGLEIEYDKKYEDYYKFLLNNGIDYLILGQHCTYNEEGLPEIYMNKIDDKKGLNRYKLDLINGMKSGYFSYVCHPDFLARKIKNVRLLKKLGKEIGKASNKYNIPLEINCGGMLGNNFKAMIDGTEPYPNHYFFKEIEKLDSKVVVGIDAHSPMAFKEINETFLKDFIVAHKLNLLEHFRIKENG